MKTYRVLVRIGGIHVWAQTSAQNPNSAKLLLAAQYGQGNIVVVSTQVV